MATAIEQAEALLHSAEEGAHRPSAAAAKSTTTFEWFFVIFGGIAVYLPFVLWIGEQELTQKKLIHWYYWLSVLISAPHVYATFVRLQRKISEGKASYLLGVPLYLGVVVFLSAVHALGLFVPVITFVNVWQSYHYLRQTYGVGCLYGRQAEFDGHDARLRWWGYHLVFPYLIIGRWDSLYDAWGGKSYNITPVHFGPMVMGALGVVALVGLYTQFVAELRQIRRNGRNYNPTGLICYVICMAVHYYGFMVVSHFQRGFQTITFFHAMQYLALVWVLERQQRVAAGQKWIAAVPNLAGFALFWLVLFVLGYGWEHHITTSLRPWWAISSTILLASISVHHYIVDGCIWHRSTGA